jgi:hypothetical protein
MIGVFYFPVRPLINFDTMRKSILFFVLAFSFVAVQAQQPTLTKEEAVAERTGKVSKLSRLASTITVDELTRHLTILASDEFAGRETGTEGEEKARNYISGMFKSYGLPAAGENNTYFQGFSYISENWEKIGLDINGESFSHLVEYFSMPSKNSDLTLTTEEVVFLGYGIDDEQYSDYKGKDVKGKVLLIMDGEPEKNGKSLITGADTPSDWSVDMDKKLKAAKMNGAAAVFIMAEDYTGQKREVRQKITSRRKRMGWSENAAANFANNIVVSENLAREITGKKYAKIKKLVQKINKKGQPKSLTVPVAINLDQKKKVKQLQGKNVIGLIEGTDEKLKNEYVFLTAHYDHIGEKKGNVYNGADDNGSGTSALLEIAQAFAEAKTNGWGPKRSVVVMLVSGEEKGLLGSKYYVENPLFSLENTIVNINVDMIGRVDEKHQGKPDYIYVIGADRLSSELHDINEKANQRFTQLELDYTYNAENDPNRYYYRSDHYNFAQKGIPAIFYFNGTHADYHRASDTVEKIDFETLHKRSNLIFYTAWDLANRPNRIVVDKE